MVKILFCAFQPFLNSPQNSEYFEYRHIRSNKKISPCHMPITKSPAPTKPIVLYNHFGVPPPPLWGRVLTRMAPVPPPPCYLSKLAGGGVAQGLGMRLFAFGGAYWPPATAHSDPLCPRRMVTQPVAGF